MGEENVYDVSYIVKVCSVTEIMSDTAKSINYADTESDYVYLPRTQRKIHKYMKTLTDVQRIKIECRIKRRKLSLEKN